MTTSCKKFSGFNKKMSIFILCFELKEDTCSSRVPVQKKETWSFFLGLCVSRRICFFWGLFTLFWFLAFLQLKIACFLYFTDFPELQKSGGNPVTLTGWIPWGVEGFGEELGLGVNPKLWGFRAAVMRGITEQWKRAPGWLGYRGWSPTQVYRDYNKPL